MLLRQFWKACLLVVLVLGLCACGGDCGDGCDDDDDCPGDAYCTSRFYISGQSGKVCVPKSCKDCDSQCVFLKIGCEFIECD